MKRKWDISTNETRKKCVDEVIARIDEQDGSEFGVIAAEEIIDIVLQNVGPDIYNSAIADTKKLLHDHFTDLDFEVDLLKNRS